MVRNERTMKGFVVPWILPRSAHTLVLIASFGVGKNKSCATPFCRSSGASLMYLEGFGSYRSLLAVKSVRQHYAPTQDVLGLLEVFRRMVNESIRAGLANDASSLRNLSQLSYNQLAHYDSPSCYKLCPISRAAGILAARKKSLRRRISHQRALYCQTAARIMLRLQDEERRIGDSDRERETSQHTPNQAHAKV